MSVPPGGILWSAMPAASLVIDAQDRIRSANPAAETLLNLSAKALRDRRLWDRLEVEAPLERFMARARALLAPLSLHDVEVICKGQPAQVCDMHIAPMTDPHDHLLVQIYPRDIAGRLGRAHSSQTAAKSAIGMSEMLAHEIKNPLAGITGAAQLLSMNLEGDDVELTDLIVVESRRIVKLLEQVEQFGNLSPPALRPANIHDILDRARKSALVGFASHMEIIEDYDPSLPPTFVDTDQFVQVFLNLLKNAAQVSQAGGTIKLRTFYDHSLRLRKNDGTGAALPLQIEVIDDGPGIPKDIAAEIFEPFVSGRENGTGLGLALVSKIVAENNGWIAVNSAPGKTAFRISLPVAPIGAKN